MNQTNSIFHAISVRRHVITLLLTTLTLAGCEKKEAKAPEKTLVRTAVVEPMVRAVGLAKDVWTVQGQLFILTDLESPTCRADLERFTANFIRTVTGTDRDLYHPDFTKPIVLMWA